MTESFIIDFKGNKYIDTYELTGKNIFIEKNKTNKNVRKITETQLSD